jgi:hypothetical protein
MQQTGGRQVARRQKGDREAAYRRQTGSKMSERRLRSSTQVVSLVQWKNTTPLTARV